MVRYLFGNWKMHLGRADAMRLASEISSELIATGRSINPDDVHVSVMPPTIWLEPVARTLEGKPVTVGGQHCHGAFEGAYTGEISAEMMRDAGAQWCLVGHSERRRLFNATPRDCAVRLEGVLRAGLRPIICVGETQQERDSGRTIEVLKEQLAPCFEVAGLQQASPLVAYEPVWAIGTGRLPSGEDILAAMRTITQQLGREIPILYGGSVTPENAGQLIQVPKLAGFLVGGASLSAPKFISIAERLAR